VTPAQKLVITALALRSGLCQSRLERKAENPFIAILQRLARGLRVRVQDLLRGGPGDPAP
jgi:hypothetical protein